MTGWVEGHAFVTPDYWGSSTFHICEKDIPPTLVTELESSRNRPIFD